MPPLTSTFLADFESFYTACQQAEKGLEGIEQESLATAKQIDTMVGRFRGDKVVAEADAMIKAVEKIGGATRLTDQELAKLQATAAAAAQKLTAAGATVPESMQKYADSITSAGSAMTGLVSLAKNFAASFGIAFSAQAVVGFAKNILASADALVTLSDKTGMTIEEVQQLEYIAGQTGTTVDQLTGAVSKLQANLGDKNAQAAIKDLGINFEQLRAAQPYQQLEQIAAAIEKVQDPADRARVAVQLFGEGGIAILPTLTAKFQELGDEAPKSTEATIRALAGAGDALERAAANATTWATNVIGNVVQVGEKFGWLKTIIALGPGGGALFTQMSQETQAAAAAAVAATPKVTSLGAALRNSAAEAAMLAKAEREAATAAKAAAAEREKIATAFGQLKLVTDGYATVIAAMNPKVVEQGLAFLKAGANISTVAAAYELTTVQAAALQAKFVDLTTGLNNVTVGLDTLVGKLPGAITNLGALGEGAMKGLAAARAQYEADVQAMLKAADDANAQIAKGFDLSAAATEHADTAAKHYALTLQQLSSSQLEATASMHEWDAAANRMSGAHGAFWSAAEIASQQEEMARKAREAAGKAKVREAFGTEVWGRGGSTSTVTINVQTAQDRDIANQIVTSMRHEGIRL